MSYELDEFENHIRRIATEIIGARHTNTTLCCTAYDPKTHAVKGILQPSGVESGWVPIAAMHVGNGYGILAGPMVGDANGVGGDQFSVDHEAGDPNNLVARHKQFSTVDAPPQVQPGEMLLKHANGNSVAFTQDGSLTVTGQNGSITKHRPDGSIAVTPAPGKFVYHGGDPAVAGSFDFVQTLSGPSTTVKARFS